MKIESFPFTVIGGREDNQDAYGQKIEGDSALFVVADGLGGHRLGSLASGCVVSSLTESWKAEGEYDAESMTAMIGAANDAVLKMQEEQNCGAKSTVVLLSLHGRKALWANSGDSRLYFLRDGDIRAVTEDHSVAYKKYRSGEITRAEIATDEDQSSLLRTLGGTNRWQPDIAVEEELKPGDAFLLCSDGFWEYVSDEEILIDRMKAGGAEEWGEKMLLRLATRIPKDCDNLTMITVMLGE